MPTPSPSNVYIIRDGKREPVSGDFFTGEQLAFSYDPKSGTIRVNPSLIGPRALENILREGSFELPLPSGMVCGDGVKYGGYLTPAETAAGS